MQTQVAKELGVSTSALIHWLTKDEKRLLRVRASKAMGASVWDEEALSVVENISDSAPNGAIARAREVAAHLRWRASNLNRAEYGETKKSKIEVTPSAGGAAVALINVIFKDAPSEE